MLGPTILCVVGQQCCVRLYGLLNSNKASTVHKTDKICVRLHMEQHEVGVFKFIPSA